MAKAQSPRQLGGRAGELVGRNGGWGACFLPVIHE